MNSRKKHSFQNKIGDLKTINYHNMLVFVFLCVLNGNSQIVNYISNGSFESLNSFSSTSLYTSVNYWQAIDTNKSGVYLATKLPPFANAPYALGFQYPRTGNNYIIASFIGTRSYPRNRLKETLKPNTVYCVTFYVVNTNNNPYAIGSIGAYFGNSNVDTIQQCNLPLTFLTPQVEHSNSVIITDTLNWIPITGTFVANGTEKYMVLGNFKSQSATNTVAINPTYSLTKTADFCIEDVSCIELNLPAFAGRDTSVVPGSQVYLGRQPDVGIDEACVWYKLPGSIPIDTVAGLIVSPATTSTYVVVQTICGFVKSDTVVVHMDLVGLSQGFIETNIELFPQPAQNELTIKIKNEAISKELTSLAIYDHLGQMIREEEINIKTNEFTVRTENLPIGIYSLQVKTKSLGIVSKKLLLAR